MLTSDGPAPLRLARHGAAAGLRVGSTPHTTLILGGYKHERAWEEDTYDPKRFLAFHTGELPAEVVGAVFDVVSFDRVPVELNDARFHFQSLILKKGDRPIGPAFPRGDS